MPGSSDGHIHSSDLHLHILPLRYQKIPEKLPFPFPFLPQYIFTNIDDTLTWHGRLPVQTFYVLEALKRGIHVTGACSAWCDCIVRPWPISTVIGENSAVIMSTEYGFTAEYIYEGEII